jgi:hypothetical protein
MSSTTNDIYITCVRRKGHPKKHIDVCHQCRWRSSCKPYQKYRQPGLPLEHSPDKQPTAPQVPSSPPKIKKSPVPPPVATPVTLEDALDLMDIVKKELLEIRDLCA